MKLLHIITGLSTGGAERALYNLLAGGLAGRYENTVLSLSSVESFGPLISELGIPVKSLGMTPGRPSPVAIMALGQAVRKLRPDVIQGWMYHGNIAAWIAHSISPSSAALVWNIRHSLYDLNDEKAMTRQIVRLNRVLSSHPAAIIYNSRISREQHEAFGLKKDHARVIPNGFDPGRLAPSVETNGAVRDALKIPRRAVIVGHVARFHPVKDHTGFLAAAVRLASCFYNVHFVLAGKGVVPENPILFNRVPANLKERFHFLGDRSDVFDLMRAMDVFCISSRSEAFPNVIGEAMAAGVPVVATDVGDSRDIVGKTGAIVPPGEETALFRALSEIIQMPDESRRALGNEARARVKAFYSLSAVVDQYAELYDTLYGRTFSIRG